jgi:hypothetical protein
LISSSSELATKYYGRRAPGKKEVFKEFEKDKLSAIYCQGE